MPFQLLRNVSVLKPFHCVPARIAGLM